MKKFLIIGLGLSLLVAAVVPFVSASRDAYQVYLQKQALENLSRRLRPFTESRIKRAVEEKVELQRSIKKIKNLRYPVTGKRYYYDQSLPEETSSLPFRGMSDRIGVIPPQPFRLSTTMKRIDNEYGTLTTYENDIFSIQIPEEATPSHEEGVFTLKNDEFVLTVKHFDAPCETRALGFGACAIALSKDQNYTSAKDKILSSGQLSRANGSTDKVLGESNNSQPFYLESFVGATGGKDFFVSRYLVQGFDKEVFLIEARIDYKASPSYLTLLQKMFDSFRIYSPEKRASEGEIIPVGK